MTQHQAPEVTPFDTRNDMGREHSLHCFACGGAVGTRTCTCLSYPSMSRDAFANALAWAYRDGAAATQPLSLTVDEGLASSVRSLHALTVDDVARNGPMSSTMVRAGLLLDILDRLQSLSLPVDIDRSGLAQEVES